jgi:hypothetical protein
MKASKRNLRKKLSRYAKKVKLTNNDKDNQDELDHNKRVDIFYNPNKVSKEDIFMDEMYIMVLHIADLEV